MDVFSWMQLSPLHLGIAAGLLQACGYILYLSMNKIEPQPITWFMWGSTTWAIAGMEAIDITGTYGGWGRVPNDARSLLALPIICGFMAAIIAIRCWQRGKLRLPEDRPDQIALVLGMSLTGVYIVSWLLNRFGFIGPNLSEAIALAMLILLNLVTLIEFSPLIRNTRRNPNDERAMPWGIWTTAYACLFGATLWDSGLYTPLLVYPLINGTLHGLVGWYARPRRRRAHFVPAE